MVTSNIKVYLRIRPSGKPSKAVSVKPEDGVVAFELDKAVPDGQVNNSKTAFKFRFDGILEMGISQEDVFNKLAKPVIEDVLQGINGTIFAYGQTGSGKTFTITGGAERYADRGLIPRTISYLFEAFRRGNATYRMYVSYLEIYNDYGYDLLSRDDSAQKLEDLPKVQLREDEDGNIHLRNLSVNVAGKEEDALNLLFLGDTNRVVAETPMNDASTRSHCMFILWIDSTQPDSDTVRRAKLHLVDLAGSERISKTGVEGNLAKEARYINLSLHYLEQVIVALHERSQGSRPHVPYRNSMMTSVLRDSLGGNCKTVMVGTCAVEQAFIDETISTCRFAQRVATIKNNAQINEELDPALLIKRLKKEVAELKDELRLLSNDGEEDQELTPEEKEECKKLVATYLEEQDPDAMFVCGSTARFRECFRLLREVYWQHQPDGPVKRSAPPDEAAGAVPDAIVSNLAAAIPELQQQIAQRDQEINMLVTSLGKFGKGREAQTAMKDGRPFIKSTRPPRIGDAPTQQETVEDSSSCSAAAAATTSTAVPPGGSSSSGSMGVENKAEERDTSMLLLDRNKAFEVFRKSVRRTETLEENRETLKRLYAEARADGERANAARTAISMAKSRIDKIRMERTMSSNPRDPESAGAIPDAPEATQLLAEIEEHKRIYQQATQRLHKAREEIEQLKKSAEQNKQRLQQDFEAWYHSMEAQQQAS